MKFTNEERGVLTRLRKEYKDEGREPLISWNNLRLESAILGTQGQIAFDINQISSAIPATATETRLNLVDRFTATRLGIFLMKTLSAATAAQRATARLRTYPNPQVFVGAGEADNLYGVYSGANIFISINSLVYFPSLGCEQFYRVPMMQELLAQQVTAGLAATAISYVARDPWPDDENGKIMLIPDVTFSGGKNNVIRIELAANLALVGTTSDNVVVMLMDGFLQQNVNSVNINK